MLTQKSATKSEVKNCVVGFVPKRSKMNTFGRVGYIDGNGCCHVRVCTTIEKRKRRAKGRYYFYGTTLITGLNPQLEGQLACIQITVPRTATDTKQFLEQRFESWPTLIETEDREKAMKSIAEKWRKLSNGD